VADDAVVVRKFRPVKPGNSVEEKNRNDRWRRFSGLGKVKSLVSDAKGGSH